MKRLLLVLLFLLSSNQTVWAEKCRQPCKLMRPAHFVKLTPQEVAAFSMTDKEIWAHIVSGEAGGLVDGAELVAWTLRSWEVYRGMPAGKAGPRWGWYGWNEPTGESWAAVQAVWNKPMSEAPYEWMRNGKFCILLGNDTDLRYWNSLGWNVSPDFRLEWPVWNLAMNCIWE